MNGCRMDDPHNDNSAANIFGELIRRKGASYGREVPARASYGREVPARASYGREVPARASYGREVPARASSSGADSAGEEVAPTSQQPAESPARELDDSAEGSGGESPPPLAPTDPPTGAGFLQPQGDGTRFFGGMLRALLIFPLVALLSAAIATFAISWQQRQPETRAVPTEAPTPTIDVTPRYLRRIGIVAGHRGVYNDPGAVCEDGLTEREVNEVVAEKVVLHLRGLGYHAELLDEFDSRLKDYQAEALISLHVNDCKDYGEYVTGYLIARAAARAVGGADDLLVQCLGENYAQATGLRVRAGVTSDMSEYHSFVEIHPYTPAAILEMGFLLADRRLLTERADIVARGVYDGILCFLAEIGST